MKLFENDVREEEREKENSERDEKWKTLRLWEKKLLQI